MQIEFTKMQALGNDFMVIDGVAQKIALSTKQIQQWADRRIGVGFDQLLLLEQASDTRADFNYRIFNADGSEVAQCGNGARCIAQFVAEKKLSTKRQICLQTSKGYVQTELNTSDTATASLGVPVITDENIILDMDHEKCQIGYLSVGNPHAILLVEDVAQAKVARLGPLIEKHFLFQHAGVNVSFVQIIDQQHIKQRVWERGVGETPACGSAACAAVVMGIVWKKLAAQVTTEFPGGSLEVKWDGLNQPVYLTGKTQIVYHGTIDI